MFAVAVERRAAESEPDSTLDFGSCSKAYLVRSGRAAVTHQDQAHAAAVALTLVSSPAPRFSPTGPAQLAQKPQAVSLPVWHRPCHGSSVNGSQSTE
ncbi:hypothetical protein CPLU01_12180 [Colletotrichum plurivorum]|uniref:Uncharacterized protein n=1 Tax=Colletotrichum plurivorum TaxID=2175906 RepID=A0A8H6JZW3_9PEZI|nr:hypothetical protein CPLU01_12180 [Colletotrichum plurivorum]